MSLKVVVHCSESAIRSVRGDILSKLLEAETFAFIQEVKDEQDEQDEQLEVLSAYYCNNDDEAAKLGTIYRSVLLQLLRQRPNLKIRFWNWHKEMTAHISGEPTQSDEKLRGLLCELISSCKEWVFIVLDALDKCYPILARSFFSLFQNLFKAKSQLKIFVSSGYDDGYDALLSPVAIRMDLLSHHESELTAALHRLPVNQGLADIFGGLLPTVSQECPDNEALLRLALETLAVAQRPLTADELTYAMFLNNPLGEYPARLPELKKLASGEFILRPWV
ncbi:hypothetical protein N0V88_003855 [Collariella sp. IMI 366227]|nr:hypothetical protein N0V88_003855 [Collariella sp. IMI 366227]